MESQRIYEESYNELDNLQKQILIGNVSIDFSKFDTETSGALHKALAETIAARKKEVFNIIQGVH